MTTHELAAGAPPVASAPATPGTSTPGNATPATAATGAARSFLAQISATVRLQLLAAQLAEANGTDPDHAITGAWAEPGLWSAGAPPG